MTTEPAILPLELRGVSLSRGGKQVLKDIDLRIEGSPARTLIIGPNGAGKSLLLRICHGMVSPDRGEVRWAHRGSRQSLARRQAMVFQRPVLLRRSAADNIDFALKLQGLARAERRRRVEDALERTGLTRFARAAARGLSFGEQQRLALARAMAARPQVLFLDEPTANLDPAAAHLVEEIILSLSAQGTRIVMVSHDLGQSRRLADEILFLYRGRIKERAPAGRFFASPSNDLAQAFLNGELLWWPRRSIYGDERSAER